MIAAKFILNQTVFALLLLGFTQGGSAQQDAASDAVSDTGQVRAVYQAYADIWMRNDETVPAGIMNLFTDDAAIMPHHGDPIRKGKQAISDFWFPGGKVYGTVDAYAHQVKDVQVIGDAAYIYGRFTLKFTFNGTITENEGNQLAVMRRTPLGWKIAALIWNDPIPQTSVAE